jgi:hypothetical protein
LRPQSTALATSGSRPIREAYSRHIIFIQDTPTISFTYSRIPPPMVSVHKHISREFFYALATGNPATHRLPSLPPPPLAAAAAAEASSSSKQPYQAP